MLHVAHKKVACQGPCGLSTPLALRASSRPSASTTYRLCGFIAPPRLWPRWFILRLHGLVDLAKVLVVSHARWPAEQAEGHQLRLLPPCTLAASSERPNRGSSSFFFVSMV